MSGNHSHFQGKDALGHIIEKRDSTSEPHGAEMPGHLSAACDTARLVAFLLMLLYIILLPFQLPLSAMASILLIFGCGSIIIFAGRRAWMGWAHLERLHRLLEQERYEITHHRPQERDELKALYSLKGFEGTLLEQVVDVLMADDDRLLRVMLEEEMGLSLGTYEHPVRQSLGAIAGGAIALLILLFALFFLPSYGLVGICLAIAAGSGALTAYFEDNNITSAFIWNLAIGALSAGIVYFTMKLI